jgi:MFS family permease
MPSLIVFRLIQGIGAGAVQPTAMTIVGDLYSAHERGKIQGWLASVWAGFRAGSVSLTVLPGPGFWEVLNDG